MEFTYKLADYYKMLKLPTKEVVERCISMRLIPGHRTCPKCGRSMLWKSYKNVDNAVWRCRSSKKESKHSQVVSIRKGTWFEKSTLGMEKILLITAMWVLKLQPHLICQESDLNKSTVGYWINFCREVCYLDYVDNPPRLGGEGMIIQIDEYQFSTGEWVFGGFDVQTGDIFLEVPEKRDANTLTEIVEKYVLPGTIIISNGWKASSKLGESGCQYLTENHKIQFITGPSQSNFIKSLWSKGLYGRWRRMNGHLPLYLAEYRWRRLNQKASKKNKNPQAFLVQQFFETIIKRYPG